MRPAAVLCVGLFLYKLCAMASLWVAGIPDPDAPTTLATLSAFGWDAALVLVFLGAGLLLRGRALAVLEGTALLLALFAVLNVPLMAAFGSPLSASMLAYAADARAAAAGVVPLVFAASALVAFVLAVVLVAPRLARIGPRVAVGVLASLVLLALAGYALDHDGGARALGLWRSPPAFFVRSLLPHAAVPPERAPWDAPTGKPRSAGLVERAPVPRHVVVWLAESTGPRHVSLYGAPRDRTPQLESLREHALILDEYYAPTPVSAKAIFSTMCGLFPYPDARFEARLFPRIACPSLPETLAPHGFSSALFHGGYFAFTDKRALLEERGFDVLFDGENMPGRERWWTNGWGIDDAALVDEGLRWLDAQRPTEGAVRTLSVYIPLLPHYEYFLPPTAKRPFGDDSLEARHRNGVAYDDEQFGKLVDGYRARGLFEDTLFVFLGDHGEAFGEHPNNKLHGSFLYDENVRAPLVFINPHLFPRERRTAHQGAHPDLVPTILDLLDLPIPASVQGRSLVSGDFAPRPIPLATFYPDPLVGIVDGPYKLIRDQRTGAEELFDRARDPHERKNLARLLPDVTTRLRARVLDYVDRQKALLDGMPKRGMGYLDRFVAALSVSVRRGDAETPCARAGDRFLCADGAWVGLAVERSFNMERRCLVAHPVQGAVVVLRADTQPPPRTVGVGLTDRARQRRGTPVSARFFIGDAEPVDLVVDDVFETTSKMRALPSLGGSATATRVEIATERAAERAVCITLGS